MHSNASIVFAGDITVERLANPPVIIPTGAFWEGLEEYWSDLVNELPDIPNGGNHYFMNTLKPSLGQCPASEFCQPTRAFLHGSTCLKSHNMCLRIPNCLLGSITCCNLASPCSCLLLDPPDEKRYCHTHSSGAGGFRQQY